MGLDHEHSGFQTSICSPSFFLQELIILIFNFDLNFKNIWEIPWATCASTESSSQ